MSFSSQKGFITDINTPQFHQLSRWLFPDDPAGDEAGCGVLGWRGYTWSAVVRPFGRTAKFSKTKLEAAYGREIHIQFSGNSSGGHSCSEHANCTLPQLETSVALCCDKTAHFSGILLSPAQGATV